MDQTNEGEPDTHLISRNAPIMERVEGYARRIQIHVDLVASENPGVTIYRDWSQVPERMRTRSQWDDQNRRVPSGTAPAAIVIWPEIVEVRDDDGRPTGFNDVRCRSVRLYSENQTRPFVPTALDLAHREFFDIFVRPCSRKRYGFWSDDDAHWKCRWSALSKSQARSHVSGAAIYGVYGGSHSRFVAIDLDLHDGDRNVFLEQLDILLRVFAGKDGWHLQVADADAGGVHLLKVVPLTCLDELRASLRASLEQLDAHYPEQALRALATGMRSLGEVEIFPNPKQVFRLPLCRGRIMLLDRPLGLIENTRARHGTVQDVETYIDWLHTSATAVVS